MERRPKHGNGGDNAHSPCWNALLVRDGDLEKTPKHHSTMGGVGDSDLSSCWNGRHGLGCGAWKGCQSTIPLGGMIGDSDHSTCWNGRLGRDGGLGKEAKAPFHQRGMVGITTIPPAGMVFWGLETTPKHHSTRANGGDSDHSPRRLLRAERLQELEEHPPPLQTTESSFRGNR